MTWTPPRDLDPECECLCAAMNRLPGIATTGSCSGHGREPFRIWFVVTDFAARGLVTLARLLCPRYGKIYWPIVLEHGDTPETQVSFKIEGPRGAEGYLQAGFLAALIEAHIERRVPWYNILYDEQAPPPEDEPEPL